jgi:alkylation response protein AidB-like acyl-CoA dehydrogenase
MDTPGITVRPLWTIQNDPPAPIGTTYGTPRTNETFFDDVRIPASCMLGKENEGWRVGAMGLNLDRVGAARYLISVRRDEDIVNFVKQNNFDGYSPASEPAIRDKIAELWIEAQVCRLMTMRSMSIVEHGGNFTYEGSAEKVWAPEHGVRTTEAISQMLGPYAQLLNGSPHAVEHGVFAHNLMGAFQSGINHGSTQVMRDQVARRGLEMPRQ